MKKLLQTILFLFFIAITHGQPDFRVVLPQQAVVEGESFQVQFIIEDAGEFSAFRPPQFRGFRFISGPNTYTGSAVEEGRVKNFHNLVYTLEASRQGSFTINTARVNINGRLYFTKPARIDVISKASAQRSHGLEDRTQAGDSEYFLKAGEDPHEKIRRNLFLKVLVDKNTCFVGEPVVATFKLYSRLESRSEVIKNPGFYGFGVYDMVSLGDRVQTIETVNGRPFDVHVIRKVQLYPFQAGVYSVDPMELDNKVEFSRSIVYRRTEQEITEGFGGLERGSEVGSEIHEYPLQSQQVDITVKPLPVFAAHNSFEGAVGDFTIEANLEKGKLARNEEGFLVISISGKGNFTQFGSPEVKWPAGIEGFEPRSEEVLDKNAIPLAGVKIFRHPFVASRPGEYELPAVNFIFFDSRSATYKQVSSEPLRLIITEGIRLNIQKPGFRIPAKEKNYLLWGYLGIGLLLFICLSLVLYTRRKNRNKKISAVQPLASSPTVETYLERASQLIDAGSRDFYRALHEGTWQFLAGRLKLSGTEMNKLSLAGRLTRAGVQPGLVRELLDNISNSQMRMYTQVEIKEDKETLLQQTQDLLEEIGKNI